MGSDWAGGEDRRWEAGVRGGIRASPAAIHLGDRPEATLEELWEKTDGLEGMMKEMMGMMKEMAGAGGARAGKMGVEASMGRVRRLEKEMTEEGRVEKEKGEQFSFEEARAGR